MIGRGSRYSPRGTYISRDPRRFDAPIVGPHPYEPVEREVVRLHRVTAGERIDHLAARYYGDPLKFHLICDANDAIFPEDLMVPGRILKIPVHREV